MFIESLRRNWPPLHLPCFLSSFVTSHGSLPKTVLHLTCEEHWWSSEMLRTSPRMAFIIISVEFFFVLIFTKLIILSSMTKLTYLMIPHINVLNFLVMPVILRKMNSTLTIAMDPSWILHYTKILDQSSQSQSFLWCLNCSHVLCLCRWKSNNIL